jgi:hypothetical protein
VAGLGGLDLTRPVAVLIISVLPFVPDEDDPASIVAAFRDATVPGSFLALSHGTNDYRPETAGKVEGVYSNTSQPGVFRTRDQVLEFFAGYELLEPGLVDAIRRRPATDARAQTTRSAATSPGTALLGGVGRKL